jgi:integrase
VEERLDHPVRPRLEPRRGQHAVVLQDRRDGWRRPSDHGHSPRVLGQTEIAELLRACLPRYRPLLATTLCTGMRLSELLALTWADVDLDARLVRVRAQLSRAHVGAPA